MFDHTESRLWADHHAAIARGITIIIQDVKTAFCVLHAHQFGAPWRDRPPRG